MTKNTLLVQSFMWHHNFNFFNSIFVASDTSNIYNGMNSANDIYLEMSG
jgi:hypothetical protein